ncbi:MAG: hypothetical protein H6R01_943 [Burkholderiaceae bacterium]|nr:hypothetical protein [Burkholderiaceae bacterium]
MSIQGEISGLLDSLAAGGVWAGTAPTNPTRPYITFFRSSNMPDNTLAGASGAVRTRLQIDVWASSYDEAQTLAMAVKAALGAWSRKFIVEIEQDIFEDDTLLHRVLIDISVWH